MCVVGSSVHLWVPVVEHLPPRKLDTHSTLCPERKSFQLKVGLGPHCNQLLIIHTRFNTFVLIYNHLILLSFCSHTTNWYIINLYFYHIQFVIMCFPSTFLDLYISLKSSHWSSPQTIHNLTILLTLSGIIPFYLVVFWKQAQLLPTTFQSLFLIISPLMLRAFVFSCWTIICCIWLRLWSNYHRTCSFTIFEMCPELLIVGLFPADENMQQVERNSAFTFLAAVHVHMIHQ